MMEPTLNYVNCLGAAVQGDDEHRMAYWEWNHTGNPCHPHVIVCVHGLTRQGRDFDVLARALSPHARVICPDIVGRGYSDWLADPMHYGVPQYTSDMLQLLQHVHGQAAITTLDWVGTSMGGLIGMAIAGSPQLALPTPLRKLLLNDVGPALEWSALQRIASYVGHAMRFASEQEAIDTLRSTFAGFGPHTDAQWRALSLPMLRPMHGGGVQLHYDPAIAFPMQGMTPEDSAHGTTVWWALYESIQAQILLLRGTASDLITADTARQMQARNPFARSIALENVGHAPTLVTDDQVVIAQKFLLGDE